MYEDITEKMCSISSLLKEHKIGPGQVPFEDIRNVMFRIYARAEMDPQPVNEKINAVLSKIGKDHDADTAADLIDHYCEIIRMADRIQEKDQMLSEKDETIISRTIELNHSYNEIRKLRHPLNERSDFRGRGVVYCVITGKYDELREPEYINDEWDYVLFTDDRSLRSDFWQIRYLENEDKLDPVHLQRKTKLLCCEYLKEYDYSIYIDGKVVITGDMRKLIDEYGSGRPMICIDHYYNCKLEEEAAMCITMKKADRDMILKQVVSYAEEGFPDDLGQIDSCVLVRDHTKAAVNELMQRWWHEINDKTSRDQLSFAYSCWKEDFTYDTASIFLGNNEYVKMAALHQ